MEQEMKYSQKEVQKYLDRIKELESREPEVVEVTPPDYKELKEKAGIVDRTQKDFKYMMEHYERAKAELRDLKETGVDMAKVGRLVLGGNLQAFIAVFPSIFDKYRSFLGEDTIKAYFTLMRNAETLKSLLDDN